MRRSKVALVLLVLAASPAAAQQPSNWSPVRQLTAGGEVRAIAEPGVTHRGLLRATDDDSLTLVVDGADRRLPRMTVREVAVAGKSRKKNIWWGLAIGAAVSVAAVTVQCHGEDPSCNEGSPALFYPITGAGAAIGALLPPRMVWRDVYRRGP